MFKSIMATARTVIRSLLIVPILLYRTLLSPWLRPRCRFYPSCSSYAMEALKTQSIPFACWLTLKRLCRCHPWHPGGYEPVPPSSQEKPVC